MKQMVWMGIFIGSTIGGLIPNLWGASVFSFSSIFLGATGAFLGIWVGYNLSNG
ncbi:MAG: hypothetical protein Q7S75_00790 [bacterium]|nr:hypothetical protein [bacterium]